MQFLPDATLKAAVHRAKPRLRPSGVWLTRVCHPTWVLDYCGLEGESCRIEREGAEGPPFAWRPGTWHLYAPHTPYRLRMDRTDLPSQDLWLLFELRQPPLELKARDFAVLADPEDQLGADVRAMGLLQERGLPGSEWTLHGYLLCVLGRILTAARAGAAGTPEDPWRVLAPDSLEADAQGRLLHQVDRHVTRALKSPPTLEQLAALLNMSVSSLAHRFKAETGLTVVQRIRWLRVREARRLLAQPSATVKSVARSLGFPNAFYFSRVFTQVAGLSPTLYARRFKQAADRSME
ncbi:MAG: helix-turn-helix transcriptional regulator [Planctomycetota bacterium]|nr:helix-turn-helix transcriptional regulator [Planctomycetota bacterium]